MTKRALEYGVLLAVLWFVMVLFSYRLTAVIFYSFLIFPILLFLIFFLATRGLYVGIIFGERLIQRNNSFTIRVTVRRKYGFLPIGKIKIKLKYRNVQTGVWISETLQFFSDCVTQQHEIILCAEHSGSMEVVVQNAWVYDFFGMFSFRTMKKSERNRKETVTVLPIIHELEHGIVRDNPYVMVESEIFSDTRSGDDTSQLFDIRDYREGDRLNRIHWKLSAKEEKLMVKEYSYPIDCSVLILVEYGPGNSLDELFKWQDAVRDTALSLSWEMVLDGQKHLLAWPCPRDNSVQRAQIKDEESFYEAVGRLLADVPVPQNRQDELIFRYFSEFEKEQYTNIIYVSAGENVGEMALFAAEHKKNAWLVNIFLNPCAKEQFDSAMLPEDTIVAWISSEQIKGELNALAYSKGGRRWEGEEIE